MLFPEFIATVEAARYSDFQNNTSTRVVDASAFEEMRQYILQRYAGVVVVKSVMVGNHVFDCTMLPGKEVKAASESGSCPEGTIPMRRLSLEDLTRFASLSAFLAKSPDGPPSLPK